MRRHRHRHLRGSRTRWTGPSGEWLVKARVERFVEPAVLLLLREREMHGYELLDRVPELVGEERIDVGNLYRALRALEEDGVVRSEWSAELPGPAKRTYELTEPGRQLLDAWAQALRDNQTLVTQFLDRYEGR
jgi:PadR family transcriptional regulator, regulatory protein PadR